MAGGVCAPDKLSLVTANGSYPRFRERIFFVRSGGDRSLRSHMRRLAEFVIAHVATLRVAALSHTFSG